ncbi:MAG: PIG-L family deacetylase [Burkholderiales bacterium]|nr:PIG-L family deacetylase [Burkholderiales bacterium]
MLVLAPHADDEVFGCAGAVIRHVPTGCAISVVVLSDGAYNIRDPTSQVIATREAESCAAAALLGASCILALAGSRHRLRRDID